MDTEDLLSINEAAAYLGIHQQSVRDAIRHGLPAIKVLGRLALHRADVEAYKTRTQKKGSPQRGRPKKAEQE